MKNKGLISVLLLASILMMGFYNPAPQLIFDIGVHDIGTMENVRVPLASTFYENVGQIVNEEILYYSSVSECGIGFGIGKIFLWTEGIHEMSTVSLNSERNTIPLAKSPEEFDVNFFLGDRGNYIGIKSFKTINYENVWDGVTLEFRMNDDGMVVDTIYTPDFDFEDESLHLVEMILGQVQELSKGILSQDGDEATLVYSTFLGGSGGERANSICVDSGGNVYVTGSTSSPDFPLVESYNDTYGGVFDCFILKLNSTGNGLLYATYIGGSAEDRGQSISVDSQNNVYVTGYTESIDFPLVNPIDSLQESGEAFVLKLSSDGSSLVYSTLLGGSDTDYPRALALSSTNEVYITGSTSSPDFPTVSAYDDSFNGGVEFFGGDCFVTKLESDGSSLLFSTYVGGGQIDQGRSIRVDSSGNAYVVGYTNSTDFPTQSAYDSTYNGGSYDVFAFKLAVDGASLSYSTFVGGMSSDMAYSLAIDSSNNIYVTGTTASSDFPVVNAFSDTNNGSGDCFVFKLGSTGSSLLYSTFVGGSDYEYGWSIEVDTNGMAIVVGSTSSTDFPTVNAYDSIYNGGHRDCILFTLSSTGDSIPFSSFIGGSEGDYAYSVAIDDSNGIYVCGQTASDDFPITSAYDSSFSGGTYDVFVMKMELSEEPTAPIPISTIIVLAIVGIIAVVVVIVLYRKKQ